MKYHIENELNKLCEKFKNDPNFEILQIIIRNYLEMLIHWIGTGKALVIKGQPKASIKMMAHLLEKCLKTRSGDDLRAYVSNLKKDNPRKNRVAVDLLFINLQSIHEFIHGDCIRFHTILIFSDAEGKHMDKGDKYAKFAMSEETRIEIINKVHEITSDHLREQITYLSQLTTVSDWGFYVNIEGIAANLISHLPVNIPELVDYIDLVKGGIRDAVISVEILYKYGIKNYKFYDTLLNSLGCAFLSNSEADYKKSFDTIFMGVPESKRLMKVKEQLGNLNLMIKSISPPLRLLFMHMFSNIQNELVADFMQMRQESSVESGQIDGVDAKNEIDSIHELKRKFEAGIPNIAYLSTVPGVLFKKVASAGTGSAKELLSDGEVDHENHGSDYKRVRVN